jgi:predicted nucleic acid-binding protein
VNRKVFIDTSAWIALANSTDKLHDKAKTIRTRLLKERASFVTTNVVIIELANSLCRTPSRSAAIDLIEGINDSSNVKIIHLDRDLQGDAWALFSSRRDKDWSLTDCVSFVVMRQEGIGEAFAFDRHFEQAGFTTLPA